LLDVGCGDGRLIQMIKDIVPYCSGIDLSERATAFAKAFNPNIDILCDDITNMTRVFSWITLIEVLEHIPDHQINEFVGNISRLVQSDGRLLISVPTTNVQVNAKHFRHYDLEQLANDLTPHFNIERYWWLYRLGNIEKLIRNMLYNELFVLNSKTLLKFIWQLHRRFTYYADANTGLHLVCIAKPVIIN